MNEENPGVNQTSQQTQLYSIPNSLDNLRSQQSQQPLSNASPLINFGEEEKQRDGSVIFTNHDEFKLELQDVMCHDNVRQNNNHEREENAMMEGGECENHLQSIYGDTWTLSE